MADEEKFTDLVWTTSDTGNSWIEYDFGSEVAIRRVRLYPKLNKIELFKDSGDEVKEKPVITTRSETVKNRCLEVKE